MFRYLLPILTCFCTSTSSIYAQESKVQVKQVLPSNVQRYTLDYEIPGFNLTSENIEMLNALDLSTVEFLRLETEDRLVDLPNSNYQVLLYAKNRLRKVLITNTLPLENEAH